MEESSNDEGESSGEESCTQSDEKEKAMLNGTQTSNFGSFKNGFRNKKQGRVCSNAQAALKQDNSRLNPDKAMQLNMPINHSYKQKQIVINLAKCNYDVIKNVCKNEMNWKISLNDNFNSDWDIYWQDLGIDSEKLMQMKPFQKINHFPSSYLISRKTFLAKNLKRIQKLLPDEYNFFPRTWITPNEINDLKFHFNPPQNCQNLQGQSTFQLNSESTSQNQTTTPQQQTEKSSQQKSSNFLMIVKPDQLSQGQGIFLTRYLEDINLNEKMVVQEYLQEPYLIDQLKFDVRLYVLVSNLDPLKVYLYQDGLARFATEKYDSNIEDSNIDNLYIHLTNYALNKENVGKFHQAKTMDDDKGHKRSWKTVLQKLKAKGHDIDTLQNEINQIIVKTIISAHPDMLHNYRTCQPADREYNMCFELFGFDVILNKDFKPMLLEVNHAPSFSTDSPLDLELKQNLINDTMKLIGFTVEEKYEKIKTIQEDRQHRMLNKMTLKEKQTQLSQAIQQKHQQRDQYELQNCGQFVKIYPLDQNKQETTVQAQDNDTTNMIPKNKFRQLEPQGDNAALMKRYQNIFHVVQNYEAEKQFRRHQKTKDQILIDNGGLENSMTGPNGKKKFNYHYREYKDSYNQKQQSSPLCINTKTRNNKNGIANTTTRSNTNQSYQLYMSQKDQADHYHNLLLLPQNQQKEATQAQVASLLSLLRDLHKSTHMPNMPQIQTNLQSENTQDSSIQQDQTQETQQSEPEPLHKFKKKQTVLQNLSSHTEARILQRQQARNNTQTNLQKLYLFQQLQNHPFIKLDESVYNKEVQNSSTELGNTLPDESSTVSGSNQNLKEIASINSSHEQDNLSNFIDSLKYQYLTQKYDKEHSNFIKFNNSDAYKSDEDINCLFPPDKLIEVTTKFINQQNKKKGNGSQGKAVELTTFNIDGSTSAQKNKGQQQTQSQGARKGKQQKLLAQMMNNMKQKFTESGSLYMPSNHMITGANSIHSQNATTSNTNLASSNQKIQQPSPKKEQAKNPMSITFKQIEDKLKVYNNKLNQYLIQPNQNQKTQTQLINQQYPQSTKNKSQGAVFWSNSIITNKLMNESQHGNNITKVSKFSLVQSPQSCAKNSKKGKSIGQGGKDQGRVFPDIKSQQSSNSKGKNALNRTQEIISFAQQQQRDNRIGDVSQIVITPQQNPQHSNIVNRVGSQGGPNTIQTSQQNTPITTSSSLHVVKNQQGATTFQNSQNKKLIQVANNQRQLQLLHNSTQEFNSIYNQNKQNQKERNKQFLQNIVVASTPQPDNQTYPYHMGQPSKNDPIKPNKYISIRKQGTISKIGATSETKAPILSPSAISDHNQCIKTLPNFNKSPPHNSLILQRDTYSNNNYALNNFTYQKPQHKPSVGQQLSSHANTNLSARNSPDQLQFGSSKTSKLNMTQIFWKQEQPQYHQLTHNLYQAKVNSPCNGASTNNSSAHNNNSRYKQANSYLGQNTGKGDAVKQK